MESTEASPATKGVGVKRRRSRLMRNRSISPAAVRWVREAVLHWRGVFAADQALYRVDDCVHALNE